MLLHKVNHLLLLWEAWPWCHPTHPLPKALSAQGATTAVCVDVKGLVMSLSLDGKIMISFSMMMA